jgi:hypothetical protein
MRRPTPLLPVGVPRPHSCPILAQRQRTRHVHVDYLQIVEIVNARITALVAFAPEDIDAAFEELETRCLAGEAADHTHMWSVIAGAFAGFNRHEIPVVTTESVYIDHRRGPTMAPGDLMKYLRTALDDSVGNRLYIEAVHRLTDLGAVVTHVAKGTSQEGLDAEWRMTDIYMVEGDLIAARDPHLRITRVSRAARCQ